MLLDNYKIYVNEVIALVDSMVIKSDVDADNINEYLLSIGVEVNHSDKRTWKYFLNMAGEYHSNDTPVTVISSDTETPIVLSKTNLENHPITKIEYGPGGIYHEELIANNTTMRFFIDGVFNPVSIDAAIKARDFEILNFDPRYLASNEVELIDELQTFVYNYVSRWHIRDYNETDELYTAAMFDQLYKAMVTAVINIRTSFCNTSQVSQFHLWSKLKGLYGLDKYRGQITLQQSLWLYRNVRHVILHAGSQYILSDMVDKLVNTANLEAFKYDYVKVEGNLHKSLVPDGRFVKRNFDDTSINILDEISLETEESALYECLGEAPENEREFDIDLARLKGITSSTTVNQFPTGLVKIEPKSNIVTDRFNDQQYKLDYWVYMTSLGLFNGTYTFALGSFGTLTMSAKEALILYIYANTKAAGVKLTTVPKPRVHNVVRTVNPTVNEILPFTDKELVSSSEVTSVLTDLVTLSSVDSFEEFDKQVERVIARRLKHDLQWQAKDSHLERSSLKDIIDGVYISKQVDLVPEGTTYLDWLGTLKITDVGVSDFEWYDISLTILKTLLDIDPNTTSLPSSQRAIIEILDALTGYAIIVTAGESRLGYKDIDGCYFRIGELGTVDHGLHHGFLSELKVTDDMNNPSCHIVSEDLPLANLELINEEADTIRGDAPTGLYYECFLIDHTDMIVNASGFSMELEDE